MTGSSLAQDTLSISLAGGRLWLVFGSPGHQEEEEVVFLPKESPAGVAGQRPVVTSCLPVSLTHLALAGLA